MISAASISIVWASEWFLLMTSRIRLSHGIAMQFTWQGTSALYSFTLPYGLRSLTFICSVHDKQLHILRYFLCQYGVEESGDVQGRRR